jgi:hypothetical protein
MFWLGYIAISILLLAFPVIGAFMIYSALTGKGIEDPGKEALFQIHAQFKLRGLIGVGFFIGGILMLWEFFKAL